MIGPLEAYKNIIKARDGGFSRIDVDRAYSANMNSPNDIPLIKTPQEGDEAYNYMLLYAVNTETTQELNGDPEEDMARGIYHLAIAKDRGILKNITFTKSTIPGLRESRYENDVIANATGLSVLANVYDIKVKLFGNNLFVPGMKIFIDPSGLGGDSMPGAGSEETLGRPNDPGSAAYKLGIGGYHSIYRVSSYVESGKFETVLEAVFEGTGQNRSSLGFNSPNSTDVPEECEEGERAIDLLFGHRDDI